MWEVMSNPAEFRVWRNSFTGQISACGKISDFVGQLRRLEEFHLESWTVTACVHTQEVKKLQVL
jgi:hypothetical protein